MNSKKSLQTQPKSFAFRLVDVMALLFGEFVGLAVIVRGRLSPVAPPCVRMQIRSGYAVLCTARNVYKVHQRAKSVAFRVVDVMPLVFWGVCWTNNS